MHRFETITKVGFLGSMALALIPLGCGGMEPPIRQQQSPTLEHPAVPPNTAERLQECVKEHGYQLEGGSWAFSPTIQVDREGYLVNVNAGEIPKTAPDLAACTRIALGDMAIPSYFFNLRQKQSDTATNEPTMAQRSFMGSPAVVVVVVVGLSEIVLEAGAVTILFAVTVRVVDKAVDDVAEAVKRRRTWKDDCTDGYVNCKISPTGWGRGNHWNESRCGTCRNVCDLNKGKWPSHIEMFPDGTVSCN
jgi:hypothetical protein